MTKEVWKTIPSFIGYEASNLGRVRSNDRVVEKTNQWGRYNRRYKGRVLKEYILPTGYCIVHIYKRYPGVHRLVAEAFIPNPLNKKEVNHINGNPSDNSLENLEWCTRSENVRHADRTGLRKMPSGKRHYNFGKIGKRSIPVINSKTLKEYPSIKLASIDIGCNHKHLSYLIKHRPERTIIRYK